MDTRRFSPLPRTGLMLAFLALLGGPGLGQQEAPEETRPVEGRVVAQADGSPLAEVVVSVHRLERNSLGEVLARTTTDADGAFHFDAIPVGRLALKTDLEGHALDLRLLLVQEEGGEPPLVELIKGFAIRGRVVDRSGQPVPDVRVSRENIADTTAADGSFSLERVPWEDGSYTVAAQKKGYVPADLRIPDVKHPVTEGLRLVLDAGRTANYTVFDESRAPLASATVRLRFYREDPYSDFRTFWEGTTGADGRCTISGIGYTSPFVAEIRAEGYPVHALPPRWLDEVGLSETAVLSKGLPLSGRVKSTDVGPLAGARITVARLVEPLLSFGGPDPDREDQGYVTTITSADGSFLLDGLARSPQILRIEADGHELQEQVVRPGDIGGSSIEIVLRPTVRCARKKATDVPGIAWERSVDEAFSRAAAEGRPVFLAMAMDDEPANDGIARLHFKNPEIIHLTRYTVPLLSTAFDHTPEGDPGGLDERYGAQPSSVFQEIEVWARNLIGGGQVVNVPKHLFFDPGRRILSQRTLWLTERDLRNMIVQSLRDVAPGDAWLLASRLYAPLLERLEKGNERDRQGALEDLVLLASTGDELAASALSRADLSPFAGPALVATVGRIAPRIHDVASILGSALVHGDPRVESAAARTLVRAGDEADLEKALPFLTTATPEAQRVLLSAFGIESNEHGRLDFGASRGKPLACRAAIVLARDGQSDARREVRALLSSNDDRTRVDCAYAAAAMGDVDSLAALTQAVEKGGWKAGVMARALGTMGDDRAVPFLIGALSDSSWMLREEAARALGNLRATSAEKFLAKLLDDDQVPVRLAAAHALSRLGKDQGLDALVECLARPYYRDEAERLLEEAYLRDQPFTAEGWREWIRRRSGTGASGGMK
jgi:HEAT repeat protein